jgi:flagellin-like protein
MRTLGKAKKGISPVIATIILIAITIVIAIAVAAWVFGLFKSYTGGPAVTINAAQSSCKGGNPGSCSLVVSNQGGNSVSIVGATVNGQTAAVAAASCASTSASATVTVSAGAVATAYVCGVAFTAGQTLTITLQLNTGSTVTTTIVAS